MTTYNPVNGIWTAGSYDLCTKILREEWGFDGIIMTDWWAEANIEGEKSKRENKAPMVAAQNDIYKIILEYNDDALSILKWIEEEILDDLCVSCFYHYICFHAGFSKISALDCS